ncbi:MAG: hypothetical protein AAF220_04885 [Pseudomonadota bacterium]
MSVFEYPAFCTVCERAVISQCSATLETRCALAPAIVVAADWELMRPSHNRRTKMAMSAIELSRRKLMNHIAETIHFFPGVFLWPDGRQYWLGEGDVDDAFGSDGRYLSSLIKHADILPKQKTQKRVLDAFRILDAYLKAKSPEVARHLSR